MEIVISLSSFLQHLIELRIPLQPSLVCYELDFDYAKCSELDSRVLFQTRQSQNPFSSQGTSLEEEFFKDLLLEYEPLI